MAESKLNISRYFPINSITLGMNQIEVLDKLRVMSYNVHWGVGTDKIYDLSRIARVIKAHEVDICGLQEIHRKTDRFEEDQFEVIKEQSGLKFGEFLQTMNGYP